MWYHDAEITLLAPQMKTVEKGWKRMKMDKFGWKLNKVFVCICICLYLHLYIFAFVQMCALVRSHRLTFLWKLWEAVNTRALPISAWWMDLQQTLQISSKYFTKWRKSFTNLRLMFCQKRWWKIALLRIEKHRIVNKNEHRHSYLACSTWYPKRKPGSPKGKPAQKETCVSK